MEGRTRRIVSDCQQSRHASGRERNVFPRALLPVTAAGSSVCARNSNYTSNHNWGVVAFEFHLWEKSAHTHTLISISGQM